MIDVYQDEEKGEVSITDGEGNVLFFITRDFYECIDMKKFDELIKKKLTE